jgi:hypothetical protein
LELGKLHLSAGFSRSRSPRKNIKDESAAVNDTALPRFLQIVGLRRRQVFIEDNELNAFFLDELAELLDLSAAEHCCGVSGSAPRQFIGHNLSASGSRQKSQFVQVIADSPFGFARPPDPDQQGAFRDRGNAAIGAYRDTFASSQSSSISSSVASVRERP